MQLSNNTMSCSRARSWGRMLGRGWSWGTGASCSRASTPTTPASTPARPQTPSERGCPTWSTSTLNVSGLKIWAFYMFPFYFLFVPKKLTLWLIHYFLLLVGGKSPPTDWSEKIFCHSFIISWAENNLKKNNAMVVDQVDLVDHMITLQLVRINEEWQQMITQRVIDI